MEELSKEELKKRETTVAEQYNGIIPYNEAFYTRLVTTMLC